MGVGDKVDAKIPSIQSAVSSPTALSNLLVSFSLLVCSLFPHSVGDDTPNRPFSLMTDLLSQENPVLLLMVLWPYWFGCATLAVMSTLAVLRPAWFAKALLGLPIACGSGLVLLWTVLLFSQAEESRRAMAMAALDRSDWGLRCCPDGLALPSGPDDRSSDLGTKPVMRAGHILAALVLVSARHSPALGRYALDHRVDSDDVGVLDLGDAGEL